MSSLSPRRFIVPAVFVAALFLVVLFRQPDRSADVDQWVVTGPAFGTTFTVKVVAEGEGTAVKTELAALVRDVIDRVDRAMSTYRADSEINVFNRHGVEVFPASRDFAVVVAEAQRVSRLTGGAFDITVGPLVDAWGFGPGGATESPDDETLLDLLFFTGFQQLQVDESSNTVRKSRPECRIDLSAIAKGFAVDQVAAAIYDSGIARYMVEIGGEVATRGRNGRDEVWRIGIERPDSGGRAVHVAIPLADLALATSGDYRNFFFRDGRRVSHTIDPRTGRPITHDLASVSVVHASCMTADAIATALEVLGPDEGFSLAESLDLPALFLLRTGENEFEEKRTSVWNALVENLPAPEPVL